MNAPRLSEPGSAIEAVPQVAAPLDLVFIEGFVGETVIGVHDSELQGAQTVVIDVCLGVPHARACSACWCNTVSGCSRPSRNRSRRSR